MWHLSVIWQLTCNTWHLTHDTWYMTCQVMWYMVSKFQLSSFHGFGVIMFWRFGGEGWLNQLLYDKAVFRTAPATAGLLKRNRTLVGTKIVYASRLILPVSFNFFPSWPDRKIPMSTLTGISSLTAQIEVSTTHGTESSAECSLNSTHCNHIAVYTSHWTLRSTYYSYCSHKSAHCTLHTIHCTLLNIHK